MKHFMIRYRRQGMPADAWHEHITRFIAALDKDPELGGITYRCMRFAGSDDYIHLATAADDGAIKALQSRDFFKHYTEQTRAVAAGQVEVLPLDLIAGTKPRA